MLNIYNEIETAKIAKLLNLEPSTIRRNSSILIKKKLIKIVKRDVNGNHLKLTTNGYKKLKETLPIWRRSSKKSKKLLDNYIKVLKRNLKIFKIKNEYYSSRLNLFAFSSKKNSNCYQNRINRRKENQRKENH